MSTNPQNSELSPEELRARYTELMRNREELQAELVENKSSLRQIGEKLGYDMSWLDGSLPPVSRSYAGLSLSDAVRAYLRDYGKPAHVSDIVKVFKDLGRSEGHIKTAITQSLKPGTHPDGAAKAPGLKQYPDGKIGLPDWP